MGINAHSIVWHLLSLSLKIYLLLQIYMKLICHDSGTGFKETVPVHSLVKVLMPQSLGSNAAHLQKEYFGKVS